MSGKPEQMVDMSDERLKHLSFSISHNPQNVFGDGVERHKDWCVSFSVSLSDSHGLHHGRKAEALIEECRLFYHFPYSCNVKDGKCIVNLTACPSAKELVDFAGEIQEQITALLDDASRHKAYHMLDKKT